jgi:hypothetical protein
MNGEYNIPDALPDDRARHFDSRGLPAMAPIGSPEQTRGFLILLHREALETIRSEQQKESH